MTRKLYPAFNDPDRWKINKQRRNYSNNEWKQIRAFGKKDEEIIVKLKFIGE